MSPKNNHELNLQKSYPVVKANSLIQETKYDLSTQEQKLILHLVQLIKPDDKEINTYDISISQFCHLCNITNSGSTYAYIKNTILNLKNKSFWLEVNEPDGSKSWVTVDWISKARIKDGTITIRLDDDLKNLLIGLKDRYTMYDFTYVLSMKSKYSIRLYELCKSYENLGEFNIRVQRLKEQLLCEKYDRWSNFKQKVLDHALKEINSMTDIIVSYKASEKKGRSIVGITLYINQKDNVAKEIINDRAKSKSKKSYIPPLINNN